MNRGNMMNQNNSKSKDFKKALVKLFSYTKKMRKSIVIAIVFAMVSSILTILGPDIIKELVNEITKGIITGINLDKVKSIGITLVIMYLISTAFGYAQGFIMATTTNKFTKDLRSQISIKINKLPLKFFDSHIYGDILSRVTNDVDSINQTMSSGIGQLASALTLLIGVVFMMFKTNWIMAFTAILSSIIGFIIMSIIFSKSQKYFEDQQRELGNINGHIEEVYSGHSVVKAYNGSKEVNQKFDKINNKLYISAQKSQFISGLMMPIMNFVGNFGYVCVSVVGAMLVINNTISIGTIIAFMIYIRLFTQPLATIAQAGTYIQSMAAASDRVFEFLEETEMNDEKHLKTILDKNTVKGNIEFDKVRFGYNSDKTVIKNFSAKVKPGQKIAIVGPTGAGKTTMVNLLMKFYEINSGDIKIDGVSIKELTRENIHDLFIMVLQDTWLFNGSVKENIVYNKKNVTDDDINKACETVGINHFIKTLPNGYDTVLSDAESISAGQKQLLTIARGMIEDAPFLILDEATSSVDTRTEELVQKAMDKLTEGRTSFIIAHRLSTIKNADLILVMKDGNIIEQGNHTDLIVKNGFYAELYNSQFQN